MWNKIFFNKDKDRLDGFPKRCGIEDVAFIVGDGCHIGYFDDSSDFGFYTEGEGYFYEVESVECWCYKNDLISIAKDTMV